MPFYVPYFIRLNTLTFMFLKTSGTHIFAYETLILLQLPLHLLALILKGKKTGSSLLTLTISGLTLHSLLFIEIHFNEFTVDKVHPKNIIAETNVSYTNLNIFILFHPFSLNTCECLMYQ